MRWIGGGDGGSQIETNGSGWTYLECGFAVLGVWVHLNSIESCSTLKSRAVLEKVFVDAFYEKTDIL